MLISLKHLLSIEPMRASGPMEGDEDIDAHRVQSVYSNYQDTEPCYEKRFSKMRIVELY